MTVSNLQRITSHQALRDLLRIYPHPQNARHCSLASLLYISYNAILYIRLYNWYLQEGLLKLRHCITVYVYRVI